MSHLSIKNLFSINVHRILLTVNISAKKKTINSCNRSYTLRKSHNCKSAPAKTCCEIATVHNLCHLACHCSRRTSFLMRRLDLFRTTIIIINNTVQPHTSVAPFTCLLAQSSVYDQINVPICLFVFISHTVRVQ